MDNKTIDFTIDNSNVAYITFTGIAKLNILDRATLEHLSILITHVDNNQSIKALIIQSDKSGVFIAGADIGMIQDLTDIHDAVTKVSYGQNIYNSIENLNIPTIAAIDGVCLGGGLELALACRYRLVSTSDQTKLGLPEVQLGVIPGFGGTQRLPRQIDLKIALDLIASGRSIDGKKAYKIGLAQYICHSNRMNDTLTKIVKELTSKPYTNTNKYPRFILYSVPCVVQLICHIARKKVYQKTKGHYPAPLRAISVIAKTYHKPLHKGLAIEVTEFAKLAITPISKNLINLFFTKTKLSKQTDIDISGIQDIAIVGSGFMGGSIAWLYSKNNLSVRLKDIDLSFIANALNTTKSLFATLVKRHKLSKNSANIKMHSITYSLDYKGFSGQNLIIEAVPENLQLKLNTFKEIEQQSTDNAIIASNTSSLSINTLASSLKLPHRFIGIHYFSPVALMPLVEVIPSKYTDESVIAQTIKIVQKTGKIPVITKDCAGFLINRVLLRYINEAIFLLQNGTSIAQIDNSIRQYGMPVGPLELTDEVGWDVGMKVMKELEHSYGNRMRSCSLLQEINKDIPNLLGRKSGKGFYDYSKSKKQVNTRLEKYITRKVINVKVHTNQEVMDRLLLTFINESSLCMQEQVVESAACLDFAFIAGCGFPAFRGGPLRYADTLGIENIVAKLSNLESIYGLRFKPSALLVEMAKSDKTFY